MCVCVCVYLFIWHSPSCDTYTYTYPQPNCSSQPATGGPSHPIPANCLRAVRTPSRPTDMFPPLVGAPPGTPPSHGSAAPLSFPPPPSLLPSDGVPDPVFVPPPVPDAAVVWQCVPISPLLSPPSPVEPFSMVTPHVPIVPFDPDCEPMDVPPSGPPGRSMYRPWTPTFARRWPVRRACTGPSRMRRCSRRSTSAVPFSCSWPVDLPPLWYRMSLFGPLIPTRRALSPCFKSVAKRPSATGVPKLSGFLVTMTSRSTRPLLRPWMRSWTCWTGAQGGVTFPWSRGAGHQVQGGRHGCGGVRPVVRPSH